MIRELLVRGLQSHENTAVEFSSGVTAIVGPTDSGKTALLRAVRWITRNRPSATSLQRDGVKSCEAAVLVDETWIVRRRAPSRNEYEVNGEVHGGVDRDVPLEAQAALGMPILNFGDDDEIDVHFAGQLDPPFFLAEKPSARARVVGRAVGTDRIDAAAREALTLKRQAETAAREADLAADSLAKSADAIPDPTEALMMAESAMEAVAEANRLAMEVEGAVALSKSFADSTAILARVDAVLAVVTKEGLDSILEMEKEAEWLTREIEEATRISEAWRRGSEEMKRAERQLAALVSLPEIEKALEEAVEAERELEKMSEARIAFLGAVRHEEKAKVDLALTDAAWAELLVDLNEATDEGLTCPTCGRALDHEDALKAVGGMV